MKRPWTWLPPVGGALLLSLLVIIVYAPGLNGPLVLDDVQNLLPLKLLAEQGRLGLGEVMADRLPGIDGRPVAMLSFVISWWFSGDSIWWLKAGNLLLHLLCGLCVYVLAHALLGPKGGGGPAPRWLALWVAALWLLAPVQVSTVLYTIQRMAILATLFSLAALVAHLAARRAWPRRPRLGALWWLTAILCWGLGMASKQNAAIVPLLVLVVELWFRPRDVRPPGGAMLAAVAALATLPGALLVLRWLKEPDWLSDGFALRDFGLWERVLTQARVLFDYASNVLLLPGGRAFGLFHDDLQTSTGLMSPPTTLVSLLGLAVLCAICLAMRRGQWSAVAGGALFFAGAHLVEGTVLPLELYFEHRNHLPSVGLLLALGAFGSGVIERLDTRPTRRLATVAMVGFLLIASVLTLARVENWRSWPALVSASAAAHPTSTRGRAALAVLAIESRDLVTARARLAEVRDVGGPRTQAAVALKRLIAHCRAGGAAPAAAYLRLRSVRQVQDDPYTTSALQWLADEVSSSRCEGNLDVARLGRALDDLIEQRVRFRYRKRWAFHLAAARLHLAAGQRALAEPHLQAALRLAPRSRRPGIQALLDTREGADRRPGSGPG